MKKEVMKIGIILLGIIGCYFLFFKKKGFNEYSKVGDVYRIPLIEPNEITSFNYGDSWLYQLNFKTIQGKFSIDNISHTGIKDSIIVIYSKRTSMPIGMTEAWFVIDVNGKYEKAFTEKATYEKYMLSQNIGNVKLYEVNSLFKNFDDKKELPAEWPREE